MKYRGLGFSAFTLIREKVKLIYSGFEIILPQNINYFGYACQIIKVDDEIVIAILINNSVTSFLPEHL